MDHYCKSVGDAYIVQTSVPIIYAYFVLIWYSYLTNTIIIYIYLYQYYISSFFFHSSRNCPQRTISLTQPTVRVKTRQSAAACAAVLLDPAEPRRLPVARDELTFGLNYS